MSDVDISGASTAGDPEITAESVTKNVADTTNTVLNLGSTPLSNPSGTVSAIGEKISLAASPFGIDDPGEELSIPLSSPDYLTNFCKNRNATPSGGGLDDIVSGLENVLKIADIPKIWHEYIGTAILGIFLLFFLIWNFIKYYDLLIPFAGGAFNIFKFVLIYTIVIMLIVTFFKFTSYFSFWYVAFVKFFKLFNNPLLDDNVSFLYCFLTDYVNWIIYYSAKIFYLFCVIGLILLLFLVIIPILSIVSFTIGYLFSLIGEKHTSTGLASKINQTVQVVSQTAQPSLASSLMSKLPIPSIFSRMGKT